MGTWLVSVRIQVGALAGAYGAGVSTYVILHYLMGNQWIIISLMNEAAHWLTLGAVCCLPLVIQAPTYRWFWLIYTLPAAIAFVGWYGPLFIPSAQPEADHQLTVVTWNITRLGLASIREDALAILATLDADIIGVQEYTYPPFAEIIKDDYPYAAYSNGLGIWSRYPIVDYAETDSNGERSIGLKATIDVDGVFISVYVFHPTRPKPDLRNLRYDESALKQAVPRLVSQIQQDPHPVIVLCDCNFSEVSAHHSDLEAVVHDSWQAQGFGFGLTAPFNRRLWPIVRSDYVWHSDDWVTLQVKVMPDSTSDHLPVRAILGFDTP